MKCVMSRGIYLRADGRLPCYCSAGETITLGHVPVDGRPFDFVKEFYGNARYKHIRSSMASGMVPFPGICEQCSYIELDNEIESDLIESEVEWFHWEPANLCMLDCQWCRLEDNKITGSYHNKLLEPDLFKSIVSDLARHGLTLKMGNICGVGEPTLNPKIWEMIRYVKDMMGGNILLSTNGNGPYSDEIVGSGLDKIKIAVDATTQEKYQIYRKNGLLNKAIRFTESIAKEKSSSGAQTPLIIWQYIMFNYNDTDEELITYQKMAADSGVDELRIVYTRCADYSDRTPEDFPQIFPAINFFPIAPESQLDITSLHQTWSEIEAISKSGPPEKAALETIRFINRLYHRLALGVETYSDLLSITQGFRHFSDTSSVKLNESVFATCTEYIRKGFHKLAELNEYMGNKEQAQLYSDYLSKSKLE